MPQGNPFAYFAQGPANQSATAQTSTPGEEAGMNQQVLQQAQQLFAGADQNLARLADPNMRRQIAQQLAQQFPAPPAAAMTAPSPGMQQPMASPGSPAAGSTFVGPGPQVAGQGAPDPMAYLMSRFPMTPPQIPGGFGGQ